MSTTSAPIDIPVSDGTTMRAYLAQPTSDHRSTAVIVIHELFGVNPDLRSVVKELARAGYLAVAPEFYHRHAAPGQWLPRDDAGRAAGFDLLHRLGRDDGLRDVASTIELLRTDYRITDIAVIGFSAGGHLAYLAAAALPIALTVVLYGGWLPSTEIPLGRPNPTLTLTRGITGRVVFLVGESDAVIDRSEQALIESALDRAHVDHEFVRYPGVGHAFFWPDTPAYDQAARADAWRRILSALAGP